MASNVGSLLLHRSEVRVVLGVINESPIPLSKSQIVTRLPPHLTMRDINRTFSALVMYELCDISYTIIPKYHSKRCYIYGPVNPLVVSMLDKYQLSQEVEA